jgi:hypothetical protein
MTIAKLNITDDDRFFDLGLRAEECKLAAASPNNSPSRRRVRVPPRRTLLARAEFYRNDQMRTVDFRQEAIR